MVCKDCIICEPSLKAGLSYIYCKVVHVWISDSALPLKRSFNNVQRNASISAAFTLLQANICYLERTNLATINKTIHNFQLLAFSCVPRNYKYYDKSLFYNQKVNAVIDGEDHFQLLKF